MKSLFALLKKEAVFFISAICAFAAICAAPAESLSVYVEYIDGRILGLLFSLMTAVAGLRSLGIIDQAARFAAGKTKSWTSTVFVLWLLCFVSSVFITNDVALLTFVPLGAAVLAMRGFSQWTLYTTVLQTVAANLGSMLTPMGNPQNLFLYSHYHIPAGDFFKITLPLFLLSFIALVILTLPVFLAEHRSKTSKTLQNDDGNTTKADIVIPTVETTAKPRIHSILYAALSVAALAAVFRLIPWQVAAAGAAVILITVDRKTIRSIDWFLLLTFCMFFIFSGTISHIEPLRRCISELSAGREAISAVCVSQIISNVPAALLLSAFTTNGDALVIGTNLGGLGTLVASLASLISFKLYCALPNARPRCYIAVFSAVNIALLAVLLLSHQLIN